MVQAWIDASAGVAGDMLLGALVDAGADLASVQTAVDAVVNGSVRLIASEVDRQGQRATKVDVELLVDDPPHRRWTAVRQLISEATLHERTQSLALATMARLAEAEGRVHGIDPEEVHFHEVGALDSIADVVGCCEAWRLLNIDTAVGSTVAVGAGRVRVAHGLMPVPVPAVAELALGWPTEAGLIPAHLMAHHSGQPATDTAEGHGHSEHGHSHHGHSQGGHSHGGQSHQAPRDLPGELATPTGMALVRTLCRESGPQPKMTTARIGIGAGSKDFAGRPNVVRVLIAAEDPTGVTPQIHQLEANVDDLDPRLWPGVIDALLAAGARDAWLTPIIMKKGRPAHTIHILVDEEKIGQVSEQLFASTTTLGIRSVSVSRNTLDRQWSTIDVDGISVRIKLGVKDGFIIQATPEFVDVQALASGVSIDVKAALARAYGAAFQAGLAVGQPVGDQPRLP